MFDAVLVCVIRLAAAPLANCDALRAVRALIFGRAVTGAGIVIQAQHQRLSRIGGSDAKLTEVAASGANEAVSSAGHHTSLGESAAGDSGAHVATANAATALQRDLEAARYAARRAQKQFDAADPENRLVADELERRWNHALKQVQALEEQLDQHVRSEEQGVPPASMLDAMV
jgi:hypothetical protein